MAKVKKAKQPTPGSDDALDKGCTCPVLDNGHGRGRGDGNFWISADCPMHAARMVTIHLDDNLEIASVEPSKKTRGKTCR